MQTMDLSPRTEKKLISFLPHLEEIYRSHPVPERGVQSKALSQKDLIDRERTEVEVPEAVVEDL